MATLLSDVAGKALRKHIHVDIQQYNCFVNFEKAFTSIRQDITG